MIDVLFFRSSSYNQWDYCQASYYITYNLGYQQPTQKKANLGTITHKVLECLARCKKRLQFRRNKSMRVEDEEIGLIRFSESELYSYEFVLKILDRCYEHYVNSDPNNIYDYNKDYKFCKEMVDACLFINNKQFDPREMKIVDPEKSFVIPIDEPWAKSKYNGENTSLCLKGTMDLITELDSNTLEYVDYKGFPLDTIIPTPSGFVTMENIQIGDIVFDQYGQQCAVIAKSKIKQRQCYKIVFDDTSSVVCDDEHLWKLTDGSIVPITELKKGNQINVCKALHCMDNNLPIDPYVFGIWLGDGRNRSAEITSGDKFVFEEIQNRGYSIGENQEKREVNCESRTIFHTTSQLKKLNVLNNKHIPLMYLRGSYEQRLNLLRGLMDSDGSYNSVRKQCVFCNSHKPLIDDVYELLMSLGQRCSVSKIQTSTNFKDDITTYQICFRAIDLNPFLLPRKHNLVSSDTQKSHARRRQIISITPTIIQPTQCIAVNSADNTFLVSKHMIPTHNTGRRLDWATGQEKTYEKLHTDPQLLLYKYAISKLYPNYDHVVMTIFFLRDGGPFSLCFEKDNNDVFLEMLEKRFKEIRNSDKVKPINQYRSDFRCKRLCHYYKTKWPNSDKSMCHYVEDHIKTYGIEQTSEELKKPGFSLGYYQAPGGT